MEQLLLEGEAVAFSGSREVCLSDSRTYTLRGISAAGQVEESLTLIVEPATITVTPPPEAPPDTSAPTLTELALSTAVVFDNPSCGAISNTISVRAEDSGGIKKVELHYRARTSKTSGAWQVIGMAPTGKRSYTATLGSGELAASLSVFTPGNVDVLVKAWDEANNMSQSAQISYKTEICLF